MSNDACKMDGYALFNSNTPLGIALRKHFPGNVVSLSIHIHMDQVKVICTTLLPLDLCMAANWDEILSNKETIATTHSGPFEITGYGIFGSKKGTSQKKLKIFLCILL